MWNCTFALNPSCIKDFHPDNTWWEHAVGHGGLVRQQITGVHCTAVPGCNNGPADITLVRLCHPDGVGAPSIDTPCGPTGPRGCAVCDPAPAPVCGAD